MKMKCPVGLCFAAALASHTASAAPDARSWMQRPENDPEVVAAAQGALTCEWLQYGFSATCAPLKGWEMVTEPFKDGRADATLVNMLEDGDHRARVLAARKLERYGKRFHTDKALAARVVAVAERERFSQSDLAARLGILLAHIDSEGTGLFDRVATVIREHPLPVLRSYLVQSLPNQHPKSAAVRRVVEAAIDDREHEVRMAAARGYLFVEPGGAESCAFWAKNLSHKDARVVGDCAHGLSQARCAKYHDTMLATLAHSEALTTPFSSTANALRDLCKNATPPQRAQAAALAQKIVEKGLDVVGCLPDDIRVEGLEAVAACDPNAKPYFRRLLKDKSPEIRKRAEKLLSVRK